MALLIAWELECARLQLPAVWLLLDGERGRVGASTWTSGQVVTLRGWNALRQLCLSRGLTRGTIIQGVFSLSPVCLQEGPALAETLFALLGQHLHGTKRNRLGYEIVWTMLGVVWERKRRARRLACPSHETV